MEDAWLETIAAGRKPGSLCARSRGAAHRARLSALARGRAGADEHPDFFTTDSPTAVLVRQVLGAVSPFEKANLVAKLRTARERKIPAGGRGSGLPQRLPLSF